MKKSFCICFLVLLVSMTLTACGESGQNEPRTVVDSFATAYFNWRFNEAEKCVTDYSRQWLRFAASQVNAEDVDSLRAMDYAATVEIESINDIDDSTASAIITVSDFLALDSIGKHPHKESSREFQIPLSLVGSYWRVNLSRLP